jgi:hypothetical protein
MIRACPPCARRIRVTAATSESAPSASASSRTQGSRNFAEPTLLRDASRDRPVAWTVVNTTLGPPSTRRSGVGANAPLASTPIALPAVASAAGGGTAVRPPVLGIAEVAALAQFVDGLAAAADLAS